MAQNYCPGCSDLCPEVGVHPLQCRGGPSRSISSRYSICCVPVILSSFHMLLSDPYSPKTEKQIPFYEGFILVMRHGPYLTLTAAFLFITVAIQVNVNRVTKRFSALA